MSYGLRQRPTEGVVAAAPVVAVLLAFSLFLTMLRQSRPQPPEADLGHGPAREQADDRQAGQPTAPMMFSAIDTVPALAAGTAPRPPAPPIALPAVPAEEPAADVRDDVAGDAAAERGTAVTREQPVLFVGASAAPGPTHPPAAENEAVEPQSPPAAVTSEPTSASTPEPTPATAETADTSAATSDGRDAATPAETAEASAETQPRWRREAGGTADDGRHARHGRHGDGGRGRTAPAETAAEPAETQQGQPRRQPKCQGRHRTTRRTAGRTRRRRRRLRPTRPCPGPAHAIRYASSAATEQFANEDWEAEVDPALAGQVYPVLTSDPDIEVPPHQPGQSKDLEDDAPPFATAPFATVPRLNRVRVTPTPPTDDSDEE